MKIFNYDKDITLIHEKSGRQIALGIYVKSGSIYENEKEYGIAHMIEHMMFKGTQKMNNFKLNEQLELYCSEFNAYTSTMITAYYAKTSRKYISKVASILSDMFFNATMPQKELDIERGVILSEYQSGETQDADLIYDDICKITYENSKRANKIIGTKENIETLNSEDLLDFKNRLYTTNNTCVVITGGISEKAAIDLFEKYFKGKGNQSDKDNTEYIVPLTDYSTDKYIERIKDSEESSVIISYSSMRNDSVKERCIRGIYRKIFSTGMSSRLFKSVREKYGLVYSISGYMDGASDEVKEFIDFSTSNENVLKTVKVVAKEVKDLIDKGITKKEFKHACIKLKNLYEIAYDSALTANRIYAKDFLFLDDCYTLDQYIDCIDHLDYDEVFSYKDKIYYPGSAKIAFLGKKSEDFTVEDLYKLVK